jgi:hypothetical protein
MSTFRFLRISPGTEIIREKNGDLSLPFKESDCAGNDFIPPEIILGYVTACSRDYGDTQHWPDLACQFIAPRETNE